MKVLQICNDFAGSKVHVSLVRKLDEKGVEQVVYCPVRDQKLIGVNRFEGTHVEFIYSYIIKSWYKFLYHYKRRVLYKDMKARVDLSEFDLIHAATLFSDGGLAYKAYREYGIPYIVAVRNTDINTFSKTQPQTWNAGREILLHAKNIIFLSKALKKEFEQLYFTRSILECIRYKFVFQPNGIDDYWLSHLDTTIRSGRGVLYVGDFSRNKNVSRLIEAIRRVRFNPAFKDVYLTIIGGGEDHRNKTLNVINRNSDFVRNLGRIHDKSIIRSIMRHHALFAMPSIYETFGLVYIEALSQNLPIIYGKGQGVDQLFSEKESPVGIGVNAKSIEEIEPAIYTILNNQSIYSNKQVDFTLFDWNWIAEKYINGYKSIVQ